MFSAASARSFAASPFRSKACTVSKSGSVTSPISPALFHHACAERL
jgi:hypothetical protein